MKSRIKFGFRNKNQLPLFMIWREWLDENKEVQFTEVVFKID